MTATERSKARYRRAKAVIPVTMLDDQHARALNALLAARRCTIAALLRDLLSDAASQIKSDNHPP